VRREKLQGRALPQKLWLLRSSANCGYVVAA